MCVSSCGDNNTASAGCCSSTPAQVPHTHMPKNMLLMAQTDRLAASGVVHEAQTPPTYPCNPCIPAL